MTTERARELFGPYIRDAGDAIRLDLGDGSSVDFEFFVSLFETAPENASIGDLIDLDGGRLGYIPFFERCKEAQ